MFAHIDDLPLHCLPQLLIGLFMVRLWWGKLRSRRNQKHSHASR